ncbi:MAG: transposase [Pseudomonadota bacterium]
MEATLQSIFLTHFEHYQQCHGLSVDQTQAAKAIMACRTEALGHEEWACAEDDYREHHAHSCRHRSCPRCHGAYSHDWLEKTQARLLPCDHYHGVFTLPHELNEVWQFNRKWSADHLPKAAAETLRQLLRDERYLGAEVGLLVSLHTWGRTLSFHPHVHVLVTGGGLADNTWRQLQKDFLLPVGVLKAKFRGKWLSWLNAAYEQGEIQLPEHWCELDWRRALRRVARKKWNIRIQGPYRHGDGVVNYLSRYVRGGPMKDQRLIGVDAAGVQFRYRDHHDRKENTMALKTDHFLSRVLWHVPVKGQHNVRYYGLYTPGAKTKRDLIREQLGETQGEAVTETPKVERICPQCGSPLLHRSSARRKISYIRSVSTLMHSVAVQHAVQPDRSRPNPLNQWRSYDTPP